MPNFSYSDRIKYHDFTEKAIKDYADFKEHFKPLILNYLSEMILTMDEIKESKPLSEEKKVVVREDEEDIKEIIANSKNLSTKVESLISFHNLESFKHLITKNVTKSDLHGIERCFEYFQHLNDVLKNYPQLNTLKEDIEKMGKKTKETFTKRKSDEKDKKETVKDMQSLYKKWDNTYSLLKLLIEAHFFEDKAKFKSFFLDLQ